MAKHWETARRWRLLVPFLLVAGLGASAPTVAFARPATTVSLSAPSAVLNGSRVTVEVRERGEGKARVELERRDGSGWRRFATRPAAPRERISFTWRVPNHPLTLKLRAVSVRERRMLAYSRIRAIRVLRSPKLRYVSSFSVAPMLGQRRLVLVRYLRLGPAFASEDAAFAKGAARNAGNGIEAVALICGTAQQAPTELAAAGIFGPVTVDTDPDCVTSLNSLLDGVVGPAGGDERLFLPSGRPVASSLAVSMTIQAFNIDPARAAHAAVQSWMDLPYYAGSDEFDPNASALNVPVPGNIVRASTPIGSGDEIIQGFWYGCPGCVAEDSDYHLQEWSTAHPGLPIGAFTCDQNVEQDADYVYEHGWHFPVVVYDGPLSFGACFDRLQRALLGDDFYGQTNFLDAGRSSPDDLNCEFPDLPDDSGDACETGAWTPSASDQIAPYLVKVEQEVDPG